MAVFACFLFFLMISKFKSIGLPMNSILMESIIDKNKILLFINIKWTLWTFSWLKVTDLSRLTKKTLPHQLHYSIFPSCPVFRLSLAKDRSSEAKNFSVPAHLFISFQNLNCSFGDDVIHSSLLIIRIRSKTIDFCSLRRARYLISCLILSKLFI